MAIAKLAARRDLGAAMGPTLTGGDRSGRPPLPNWQVDAFVCPETYGIDLHVFC
jgi:hypothetical protein